MNRKKDAVFCILQIGLARRIQQMTNGGSVCFFSFRCAATILVLGFFSSLISVSLAGQVNWGLPEAIRIVSVESDEELNLAIQEISAGDRIILEDGRYNGIILSEIYGTADKPIVIMAKNSRKAVIGGSRSGRNLKLSDCEYVYFHGVRFTDAEVWSVTIGPAYSGDEKSVGSRYIRLVDCEIDHSGQSLLSISGRSHNIDVINCELHDSGMVGAKKPYAEGIYIGDGSGLDDRVHDILIQGNRLYRIGNGNNWGEAIDVKCQSYNIRIVENSIQDVVVHSGGAITALFDPVNYPEGETNPGIEIEGNQILGVLLGNGGSNGSGICIGANGIRIEKNLVKETIGPSFVAFANAANTTGRVSVSGNVFYGEIAVNAYGNEGVKIPVVVELHNNIIQTQNEGK